MHSPPVSFFKVISLISSFAMLVRKIFECVHLKRTPSADADPHPFAQRAGGQSAHEAMFPEARVEHLAGLHAQAHEDASLRVVGRVAGMDADALELGHVEQQGQPFFKLGAPSDRHGVASVGDGRAACYLVAGPAWTQVAPRRLQRVAKVFAVYLEAAHGVVFSLFGSCQGQFHRFCILVFGNCDL